MATSKAKKEANARWDKKNTQQFSIKLVNREADAYRRACAAEGISPRAGLMRAARAMIAAHAADPIPSTGEEDPPAPAEGDRADPPAPAAPAD